MRTILPAGHADTVPRIVNKPPGRCSLFKGFVASVALTMLDMKHG